MRWPCPNMGQVFAKNGGFNMENSRGGVSAIAMAPNLNTQLSVIVNTQGTDTSTNLGPNMPAALVNGLVRMTSTSLGVFSVRNQNNVTYGDMCLNVSGANLADNQPGNNNPVNIIQWTCGSPVANNMLFVQLDAGENDPATGARYFMLQSVNSGHCVTDFNGSGSANIIQQWDCNGQDSQLFEFLPTSGAYGHIVAKNGGNCLDIAGASVYSGANIINNPCSTSDEQNWKLQSNVTPDSGSPFGTPELFWPNDNGVISGDWAPGSVKGQCASGYPVAGLSENGTSNTESVLCETFPGNTQTYAQTGSNCRTLMFSVGTSPAANNPSNWPYGTNYPDWDPGYYKAQCAANEFVAGVSQSWPGAQVDGILCCTGAVTASSCETSGTQEVFYQQNSRSFTGIDWDYGDYKGMCPAGEYVQGVSAVAQNTSQVAGTAHALRCCSP